MRGKSARINESDDFRCPSCGASAFEVLGTHVELGGGWRRKKSLTLKCLGCLDLFYHRLRPEALLASSGQDDVRVPVASRALGSRTLDGQ
jgi:hypothetical protein